MHDTGKAAPHPARGDPDLPDLDVCDLRQELLLPSPH